MERLKLERLSELTAISRVRELTDSEKAERQALRNEYRAAVTGSLRQTLEHTAIVYPDGTVSSKETKGSGKETSGEE